MGGFAKPGIGEAGVQVWDVKANAPAYVKAEDYDAAVKSGDYRPYEQSVERGSLLGTTANFRPGERGQSAFISGSEAASEAREKELRDAYNTAADKALTFVEGAVDALSVGMIHEHGDLAELRREVNSGSAFAGQLAGTALGLKLPTGPLRWVGGTGEAAGEAAAQALRAGPMLSRGLTEAGLGASLAGAGSLGHQISDAIVEDKPFAAEAVLHDIKLGGLLGGGLGFLGGALSKVRGRGAIEAQGGLIGSDPALQKTISGKVQDAVAAMDQAVETHAARLGMLRVLEDEGHFASLGLVGQRETALAEARALRSKIGDVHEGFASDDAKVYGSFRDALDKYQAKVGELDGLMKARNFEAIVPTRLGRVENVPGAGTTPIIHGEGDLAPGEVPEMTLGASKAYDSLDRAAFKQIYGREFENLPARFVEEARAEGLAAEGRSAESGAPETARGPAEGAATPQDVTNASPRRVRKAQAAPEAETPPEAAPVSPERLRAREAMSRIGPPGNETLEELLAKRRATEEQVGSHVDRFRLGGSPLTDLGIVDRGAMGTNREGWSNLSIPAENVKYSNYTQGLRTARVIEPADAGNAMHGEAAGTVEGAGTAGAERAIFPDGFMAPAKQVDAAGRLFAEFKDRLARDSEVARSPAVANVGGPEDLNALLERMQASDAKAGGKAMMAKQAQLEGLGHEFPQYGPYQFEGPKEFTGTKGSSPDVRKWINDWYQESLQYGPNRSPGEIASADIARATDELYRATGGRADAVGALELGPKYGLKPSTTSLGDRLDQTWLLRKAAAEATEPAAGKANKLVGSLAKKALGAAIGSKAAGVVGGLVGLVAGDYVASAGRVAGAAGRLTQKVAAAGAAMLSPRVPGTVAAAAVAANRAYAYSDAGEIHDPVQRILELKRVAASPDAVRDKIGKSLGDLTLTAPEFARHLIDAGVHQIQALSLKAPAVYFDRFNRPYSPPLGELRKFFETENTVHDLGRALDAAGDGSLTRIQAEAIRIFFPAVHARLGAQLMSDPDQLGSLDPIRTQAAQNLLGVQLTPGADPGFMARSMAAWGQPGQAQQPPAKPQAFKLRSQTSPTPADAAGGYGAPQE